ncbi:hypothetical protein Lal_00018110 [Lupinus albus]|uniref:Putative nepenthesin n=1 Tax=Lupinus albus TaxID=3870 RepID=A0A6A4N4P2_LUPAL|nr:putative nepenthesin [Lupinus albus]KAF1866725.1 hypothetical protein Lal_00018110 [Lupinus albus]
MKQVLFLAIILLPLLILPSEESKNVNGLTIDLIHRDSPLSPFHTNKNAVFPNNGDYLMKVFVGNPPVELHAIADTRSDLISVQYSEAASQCRYSLSSSRGKSITKGDLASDTIRFGSKDGPLITTPKTTLGCGNVNTENFKNTGKGVVGLGGGPLSLVSQLSHKYGHIFSYCLVPHNVNSTSKLKIGRESTISPFLDVTTTPLVSASKYTAILDGVSVGSSKLTPPTSISIEIDSGSRLTYLSNPLYDMVQISVADAVDFEAIENPPQPYRLCFALASTDFVPSITFHLSKGDIHYPKRNILVKVGDNICLSIVPAKGTSILGNLAQENLKVEYDLQKKTVSFAPTDCTKE